MARGIGMDNVRWVIGVKDAYAHIKGIPNTRDINTREARQYFEEQGLIVYELPEPAKKIIDDAKDSEAT